MTRDSGLLSGHPLGEQPLVVEGEPPSGVDVDSFGGTVRVEWDHEAAMTPLGQLPFFIDYLKTAGLFDAFVADCPLQYESPNAGKKRDVLGTAMLAMLAGAKRYAHIAALRGDAVLPELLGMTKVVSEDAIRRAFKAIDEEEGAAWLRGHLAFCVEPLLAEAWILDVDTTIKPLYGHQEGAVLGYNPKKPGRPSHCYHTYSMASTRLVFDVDVSPGDEHASKHSAPGLWAFLDRLPRDLWPALLRGDCGFGNEGVISEAEARRLPFDVIGLEAFVPDPPRGPGRPPEDRRAIARAFVAKAVLGIPTTSALIERLGVNKSLRRILGWERRSQVPSEATFARAFAEFARGELPDKIHAALIERALGERIVGAIARDATEIEAREKPVQNKANDGNDDPPAPENSPPPRRRGRPRKGEERPKPEPTRIERQVTQTLGEMLADLPTACDVGSKKNSKGYKETWTGYKLHIDVACGQIPAC